MKKSLFFLSCLLAVSMPSLFAEENSSEAKPTVKSPPVQNFASGVKKVTYDAPKDLVKETAEEVPKKPPIVSVVEGMNRGIKKSLKHTLEGAYQVATLGTQKLEPGQYEVVEPQKGSDDDITKADVGKVKISLPGT